MPADPLRSEAVAAALREVITVVSFVIREHEGAAQALEQIAFTIRDLATIANHTRQHADDGPDGLGHRLGSDVVLHPSPLILSRSRAP
jgi:hypothetical protein